MTQPPKLPDLQALEQALDDLEAYDRHMHALRGRVDQIFGGARSRRPVTAKSAEDAAAIVARAKGRHAGRAGALRLGDPRLTGIPLSAQRSLVATWTKMNGEPMKAVEISKLMGFTSTGAYPALNKLKKLNLVLHDEVEGTWTRADGTEGGPVLRRAQTALEQIEALPTNTRMMLKRVLAALTTEPQSTAVLRKKAGYVYRGLTKLEAMGIAKLVKRGVWRLV